jgi:hypothetical protein
MDDLGIYSKLIKNFQGAFLKEGKMASPSAKKPSKNDRHENHKNEKCGSGV